jgi:hypothetical protein
VFFVPLPKASILRENIFAFLVLPTLCTKVLNVPPEQPYLFSA